MSLTEANAPHDVMFAMMARWADFARTGDPSLNELNAHPEATFMQEVRFLQISDAKDPKCSLNERAAPAGWRFLGGTVHGQSVAAIVDNVDKPARMAALARGIAIASLIRAASRVGELTIAQDPNRKDALRVLKIPGLLVEAFWLQSADPKVENMVVPYFAEFIDTLLPMQPITEKEFLKIVREVAIKRVPDKAVAKTA